MRANKLNQWTLTEYYVEGLVDNLPCKLNASIAQFVAFGWCLLEVVNRSDLDRGSL